MMKLKILWNKSIPLQRATKEEGLIYSFNLEKIPEVPGIYIFARCWGRSYEALYVGKSTKLRVVDTGSGLIIAFTRRSPRR